MSEIRASIKDIELKSLNLINNTELKEVESNFGVNIEITKIDEQIIEQEREFHIEMEGKFHATFADFSIDGIYVFHLVLSDAGEEVDMKEFIEKEKNDIAFPMLSKISSMVAKVTEEFRPFPLVILPEDWNAENVENLNDK